MGVKVVPFILFALAGECLSLTPHQKQVNDVLFKMSDKLIDIEKKLTSIEERVHVLENSLTTPQENKPTNLEDAMRQLSIGDSKSYYRSLAGEKECEDKQCGDRCGDLNLKTDFYCQRDGSCQPGRGPCPKSIGGVYRSMGGLPDPSSRLSDLKKVFARVDTDRDLCVTLKELKDRVLPNISDIDQMQQMDNRFKEMDSDKDECIKLNEAIDWMQQNEQTITANHARHTSNQTLNSGPSSMVGSRSWKCLQEWDYCLGPIPGIALCCSHFCLGFICVDINKSNKWSLK